MDITKRRSINGFFISNGIRLTLAYRKKNKIEPPSKESLVNWEPPNDIDFKIWKLQNCEMKVLSKRSEIPKKVIYILHGGSYVNGLSNIYYKVACKYLKLKENTLVVMLDYRTAPDYVFPAALDDAYDGWKYIQKKGYRSNDIVIVGDSAGGNLALALTMKLRDSKLSLPNALLLMSPWTDLADKGASRIYNLYRDPMFGFSKNGEQKGLPDIQYAGETPLTNVLLSPAYGEFHDFPPMLIQIGTNEILESDSITVYKKALEAGVDVSLSRYSGMFHVFQFAGNILPESRIAWQEIKNFLHRHL